MVSTAPFPSGSPAQAILTLPSLACRNTKEYSGTPTILDNCIIFTLSGRPRGWVHHLPAAGDGVRHPLPAAGGGSPLTSSRGRVTPYQQQGAGHPLPAAGGGLPLTSSISLTSCNVAANILDTSYCFAFLMTSRKYTQPPSLPASGRRRDPLLLLREGGREGGRDRGREGGRDPSPSFYIRPAAPATAFLIQWTLGYPGF